MPPPTWWTGIVAAGRGGKPAFIDADGMLTYGELSERCNRMGHLLKAFGIARETRVAVLMLDSNDYPPVFWGAIKAGVVPVLLNTLLNSEQYAHMLADCRAKALFVSATVAAGRAADPWQAAVPDACFRLGRRDTGIRTRSCAPSSTRSRPSSMRPTRVRTRRRSGSTRPARRACRRACAMSTAA